MVDSAKQPRSGAEATPGDEALPAAWLGLLYATAIVANGAVSVEAAARGIIERICAETSWREGRIYLRLNCGQDSNDHWLSAAAGLDMPADVSDETLMPLGPAADSAAARAIADNRPCWLPAGDDGRASYAVPIGCEGVAAGALELFRPDGVEPDTDEVRALAQVGMQLGQVLGRVRLQRSALRQQQELALTGRLASMRELARNLAHEVNQPLAAVVSYAGGALQLLEQGRADEPKLRRALEQIGVQAKRASGIIQEFREFLRREDSRHERLDVTALIRDAATLVQARAREAGVTMELDLPPRLPSVVGDRVQLQQVFINLIENAVESMHATAAGKRRLRISVDVDAQLEVRICDSGTGMAPDLLPQLFMPFLTTKPHGLGMGLPISRSIVEFHGGRLSGENNPDGGMTFRVRLPTARRGD